MSVVKQKEIDKDFNFCYNKEKDREGVTAMKQYLKDMIEKVNYKFGEDSKIAIYFRVMVKAQQKGLMTLDELDKIYKKMLDKRVKP